MVTALGCVKWPLVAVVSPSDSAPGPTVTVGGGALQKGKGRGGPSPAIRIMEHQPSNSRWPEEEEAVLGDLGVFAPSPLTPFGEKQSLN